MDFYQTCGAREATREPLLWYRFRPRAAWEGEGVMAENQGGGITPLGPGGPGPSLEEEERAMKSGRGRMLVVAFLAVVGAVAAFGWYLTTAGPNEYGQFGQQINGLRTDHFDTFWSCALPREDIRGLRTNVQLTDAIVRFAASPRTYATMVRTTCMVHLEEHGPALDGLIPPEGVHDAYDALRGALTAQRDAWRALLDHLDTITEGGLDPADATAGPLLTAVVRAWVDYRTAIGEINDLIRPHVEE